MSKVIENDDKVLGRVKDIEVHFKARCMELVNRLSLFDSELECDGIECINNNLNMVTELFNSLYQDVITGAVDGETIIEVSYHPMGAYQYKIFKEMK